MNPKWTLKKSLEKVLPNDLIYRKKSGFIASPEKLFWKYSFVDDGFTTNSIYYLKVKQAGENEVNSYFAWSSPIWVNN